MEQWEHMVVQSGVHQGRAFLHTYEVSGDINARIQGSSMTEEVLAVLNELGAAGWHLVSTDREQHDLGWERTWWLRRRVN